MKPRRRVDEGVRNEALEIFQEKRGDLTNEQIAQRLDLSLRKVSQMRKEFQDSGSIQVTLQNRHSSHFQSRKLQEDDCIRKIKEKYPAASLTQICELMLSAGFYVSNSTVSLRLAEMKLCRSDDEGQKPVPKEEDADPIVQQFREYKEKYYASVKAESMKAKSLYTEGGINKGVNVGSEPVNEVPRPIENLKKPKDKLSFK
jgi:hypothetical protein